MQKVFRKFYNVSPILSKQNKVILNVQFHLKSAKQTKITLEKLKSVFLTKPFAPQNAQIDFNRIMKVFTQKFNPLSGKNEWVMQEENYDYHQEVARSSYADMLHDKERNEKYYIALKKAINAMKLQGRPAKVLDIGTGTGLLSMMAVKSGADCVTACEAFEPVAECALKVIKDNGLENKIKVIPKRSTELCVGSDKDLLERANILVTEVFDTELIGEGALSTFRHALLHLLEPESIIIPSAATVYAQIIESPLVSNFNKLRPIPIDSESQIVPPAKVIACPGAAAVHDIQMASLLCDSFVALSQPIPVFELDFCDINSLHLNSSAVKKVEILSNGHCEIIFMWWDLKMDVAGDVILSCAPPWAHPQPLEMQWRDHWMQAIYYLPQSIQVSTKETVCLASFHDEYSFWFKVYSSSDEPLLEMPPSPICSCLMHCGNSRSRIGMINDTSKNSKYIDILKKHITSSSVCLCVGDGSLLSLMAAKLGAKLVFAVEPEFLHYNTLKSYIECNQLESKIKVINKSFECVTKEDLNDEMIDVLVAEPYFASSLLPWHSLYFWYLHDLLTPLLNKSAVVIPRRAHLLGMAVEFKDLWKIRAPVVEAQGFNLSAFDKMVQKAIELSDAPVEPHPLWEYECKPLTAPFELLNFDFSTDISDKPYDQSGEVPFFSEGKCNAIALWVDFETDGIVITTGPTKSVIPDEPVKWDIYSRQGVYFIQPFETAQPKKHNLSYKITFNASTGQFGFNFEFKHK